MLIRLIPRSITTTKLLEVELKLNGKSKNFSSVLDVLISVIYCFIQHIISILTLIFIRTKSDTFLSPHYVPSFSSKHQKMIMNLPDTNEITTTVKTWNKLLFSLLTTFPPFLQNIKKWSWIYLTRTKSRQQLKHETNGLSTTTNFCCFLMHVVM